MDLMDSLLHGDSEHEIVMTFKNGAQLHRFNNPAGVPYSAIYVQDEKGLWIEYWSHTRENEERMVKDYQELERLPE